MKWILNSLERPRTHSTECFDVERKLALKRTLVNLPVISVLGIGTYIHSTSFYRRARMIVLFNKKNRIRDDKFEKINHLDSKDNNATKVSACLAQLTTVS